MIILNLLLVDYRKGRVVVYNCPLNVCMMTKVINCNLKDRRHNVALQQVLTLFWAIIVNARKYWNFKTLSDSCNGWCCVEGYKKVTLNNIIALVLYYMDREC